MDGTPPLGVLGPVGSTETGRTPERVWEGMRRCRLVVTGQSLFGGVHLEAVCQLVGRLSAVVCPPSISSGVMPRRSRPTRRRKCSGNRRSSRQIRTRAGVSGQALSGDGSPIRASDWMRAGSALGRLALAGQLVEEGDGIVAPVLHPLAISRMGPVAVGPLPARGSSARPGRAVPQPPCRRRAGRCPERPRR